jgi:hypothetical protein
MLVQSTTKIKYLFTHNYNTLVQDLSGNGNHGEKQASVSSTTVNTPYGLYLNLATLLLPPNVHAGSGNSNVLNSSEDMSFAVFFNFFPGIDGNSQRSVVRLQSGNTVRTRLFQDTALNSAAPSFTSFIQFSGSSKSIVSSSYALCKDYADKWYFIVVSVDSMTSSTDLSMCINGQSLGTVSYAYANPRDFNDNFLNSISTKVIYYSFQLEDTALPCSFFDDGFDLGSCSRCCTVER